MMVVHAAKTIQLMDGITTAQFVNALMVPVLEMEMMKVMDVSSLTGPMILFVMMATTMRHVTGMEELAARKIQKKVGIVGAQFVNALNLSVRIFGLQRNARNKRKIVT